MCVWVVCVVIQTSLALCMKMVLFVSLLPPLFIWRHGFTAACVSQMNRSKSVVHWLLSVSLSLGVLFNCVIVFKCPAAGSQLPPSREPALLFRLNPEVALRRLTSVGRRSSCCVRVNVADVVLKESFRAGTPRRGSWPLALLDCLSLTHSLTQSVCLSVCHCSCHTDPCEYRVSSNVPLMRF